MSSFRDVYYKLQVIYGFGLIIEYFIQNYYTANVCRVHLFICHVLKITRELNICFYSVNGLFGTTGDWFTSGSDAM
jgi:hypothetical protein